MLLARTLGMTLAECQERVSSSEFVLWQAEYDRNPWGEYRDNWHAAMISRYSFACMGGTPPPVSKLFFGYEEPQQEVVSMQSEVRAFIQGMNNV